MNYKILLAVLAVAVLGFAGNAHAQAAIPQAPMEVSASSELADLKAKVESPETGAFSKWLMKLRISELERKLNLAQAFK